MRCWQGRGVLLIKVMHVTRVAQTKDAEVRDVEESAEPGSHNRTDDAGFCTKPAYISMHCLQPFLPIKMSPRSDRKATQQRSKLQHALCECDLVYSQ